MVPISKTVGAIRIIPAIAIPYPVGNPNETKEKEKEVRKNIVGEALESLTERY